MSQLLLRTAGASDEEIDGLLSLLDEEDIACYQSHAGFWRLGVDAIWLVNSEDMSRAMALLDDYQSRFSTEAQNRWQALQVAGEQPTFARRLRERPATVLLALGAILAILAISLVPFFFM